MDYMKRPTWQLLTPEAKQRLHAKAAEEFSRRAEAERRRRYATLGGECVYYPMPEPSRIIAVPGAFRTGGDIDEALRRALKQYQ